MATRYSEGGVTVELKGDLERLALEAVDRIIPGVRALMEANVTDILRSAQGEWPVKSGDSRRGLEMTTTITEDSIQVKIINAVPYAVYVRPRAWFGTTTAWQRLVRGPMLAAAKDIAKEAGPTVLASLSRGGMGVTARKA